jgi:hypothetical protein
VKRTFGLFALLGFLGCFLPIAFGISLFDARHVDGNHFWLILAAFAVPMVIGFSDKLTALGSLAAVGCFGYLLVWRFGLDTWDLIVHGQSGAKAIGFAALAGFATSVLSLAEAKD